jgi:hypothetical protein
MDDAKHKLQVDGIDTFQEFINEIISTGFLSGMIWGYVTYTSYAITLPLYFIENSIYFFLVHAFFVWAYILSFSFSIALYIHRLYPKISKLRIMVILNTFIYLCFELYHYIDAELVSFAVWQIFGYRYILLFLVRFIIRFFI